MKRAPAGTPHEINYDGLAAEYAAHRQANPRVLARLVTDGEIGSRSRVLEVGCGMGNYIAALQSATGCAAWGVDPSAGMLATAGERCRCVTFRLGDAETLDFAAERFDLLFSVDVAHHLTDHAAHFREAHRVLTPGGHICTVTDSAQIIREREPLATYFPETVRVDLERYPRIPWLREIMQGQGFHDIQQMAVEFAYSLHSVEAYSDRTFSCLHLIPDKAFERGLRRMEKDMHAEGIQCTARYLLLWGTRPPHEG